MRFASTRLITDDVKRLVDFYELVTELRFDWPNPAFAELVTPGAGTLAIGSSQTLPLFAGTGLTAADNTSAIIEFQVEDVDAQRARIGDRAMVVQEPVTMPWGNRAFMLVDPDGNRVNLYEPFTDEARARFRRSATRRGGRSVTNHE